MDIYNIYIMYPMECLNIPPGAHVPPFENCISRLVMSENKSAAIFDYGLIFYIIWQAEMAKKWLVSTERMYFLQLFYNIVNLISFGCLTASPTNMHSENINSGYFWH